jgi:hypothetical protein
LVSWPKKSADAAKVVEKSEDLSSETQRLKTIYQQKLAALAGELTAKVLEETVA